MSTEARLDRLGLLHLKDDPEALQKELERGIEEAHAREAAWHEEQERRRAARKKAAEQADAAEPENDDEA